MKFTTLRTALTCLFLLQTVTARSEDTNVCFEGRTPSGQGCWLDIRKDTQGNPRAFFFGWNGVSPSTGGGCRDQAARFTNSERALTVFGRGGPETWWSKCRFRLHFDHRGNPVRADLDEDPFYKPLNLSWDVACGNLREAPECDSP